MTSKNTHWCAAPNCMLAVNLEKRHYFRFPKEHQRWLAWVQACGRQDLIPLGPEYAYRNCRLCHHHFEEKWYTIKARARLHPNAIPTKFFMSDLNNSNEVSNLISEEKDAENQQEEINRDLQPRESETEVMQTETDCELIEGDETVPLHADIEPQIEP
ncbi:52 kDa repressor of the inhibitor of the protein kinase-like, partial [Temnothorax nylanderi]|uniref:52 kDa repressor of the inhibitor of the protein kinase-like n=1 Tax=Temnothorax nylanderi TaxID=102681 RepID=UPI003A83E519